MRFIITLALCLLSGATWAQCTPILVDLNKDGIEMGPAGRGVDFDINADGVIEHTQWVKPGGDEAFLAVDRNQNGRIDDGSELFGSGTPLVLEGGSAQNGFVALAQYDLPALGGDDDGLITPADQIWTELYLWHDRNADGRGGEDEMSRPRDFGLLSFQTIPKERRYRDPAGNFMPYWAWAQTNSMPKKMLMVDVYFQRLN